MDKVLLGQSDLKSSRFIYGCMRIAGDQSPDALKHGKTALRTAIDAGFNHFDHADIYASGACENLFGDMLRESPSLREEMIITSKCGIRFRGQPHPDSPARYDFSPEHITASVEASLKRLGIDTLDMLLLHRPDYLFHAESVAEALEKLEASGKVRFFGVSNFSLSQLSLLQSALHAPLVTHQIEINIHRIAPIEDGTLDQCQQHHITPQAWSPLGGVAYEAWGNTLCEQSRARIAEELTRQSKHYGISEPLVMLAWILKHPSTITPIIGSTTPERIRDSVKALEIDYSHEDWYRLLEARKGHRVI